MRGLENSYPYFQMLAPVLLLPLLVLPACGSTPLPASARAVAPGATLSTKRYSDSYLGFAVEYPVGWVVTGYWELQDPTGPLTVVGFESNLYMGGEQSLGRYGISVAVGQTGGRTLTETIEYRLSPIVPEVRKHIGRQCCLVVGGELAMELADLPDGRWGKRQIEVVHGGRDYRLSLYPNLYTHTASDVTARMAFDTFLRAFTFIPITILPTPTITPVPTPSLISNLSR